MFKALIVDDEEDIREGMCDIIDWEEEGFSVVGLAVDGVDALEQYESRLPHLIVTDIRMTRMDGLELARQVKERNPDTKILIVSGYDEFSYAKKALKFGIENYLLKPIDTVELRKELHTIRYQIMEQEQAKQSEQHKEEELKNYFLQRLVRDDITKPFNLRELERYGIEPNGWHYGVMLIDYTTEFDEEIEWSVDDYQLKVFTIKNVIGEIVAQSQYTILFEATKGRLGVLVWGEQSRQVFVGEKVAGIARQIAELTPKYTKHDVHVGAGSAVGSLDEISVSYKHAEAALEMKVYAGEERVFSYSSRILGKQQLRSGGESHIEDIMSYLYKHYDEELNLKRLSEQFYLNPYYIGKMIKKHTGVSFNEAVNEIRIAHAKRLLEGSPLSIGDISSRIGYKYLHHFYKIFKEMTGVSPGEYRRERDKDNDE
ncbi:response regulator [Cohnella sp.]|uniref:response regulator n=1 Tax=Cohnella sp. TaxID=1883426 RepID=UPI0037047618